MCRLKLYLGTVKRLVLVETNMELFSKPGSFADENDAVPTTYKDAIKVAASSDIYYIWINSLCVLQDNKKQLL
jgi:hypothetical protein